MSTVTAALLRFSCPGMDQDVADACAKMIEHVRATRGEDVATLVAKSIAEGYADGSRSPVRSA